MRFLKVFCIFLLIPFFVDCERAADVDNLEFNPMVNFPQGDTVKLDMDLLDVVNRGIVIPSAR